jgi:hypothetical protein
MRVAVLLVVALPLAAADLWVKTFATTPDWAYHERSTGWILLCLMLLPTLLLVTRIPSALVPPAAGLLAAGVLGNVMSAVWNDLYVPNPIVVHGERGFVAFNLADVFAVVGIFLLFGAIGAWLVRNRSALPPPHEAFARVRRGAWRSDRRPPA